MSFPSTKYPFSLVLDLLFFTQPVGNIFRPNYRNKKFDYVFLNC